MIRREKGDGSITELKDGTYIVRMTQGKKPNGKPNTKSRRAKTIGEARSKLKEIRKEFEKEENRTTADFDDITVAEYFDLFLEYKKSQIVSTSYRRIESTVNEHIKKPFEFYYMSELSSNDIQSVLNKAHEKGLSHSSVKKIYDAFNACYKWAVNINRDIPVQDNPMLAVSMIAKKNFENENKEPRILYEEERKLFTQEAMRKYRNGRYVYRYGMILMLLLYTGLREGEICGLSRSNINLDKNYINICDIASTIKINGKYDTIIRKGDVKWDSSRYVPLNKQALDIINIIFEEFEENDEGLLFTSVNGTVLPPVELTKCFNRICEACGITKNMSGVGCHCLRHTFATMLFENKTDIKTVSEILGHKSITITLNTYITVINRIKAEAVVLPDFA